MHMNRGIAKIMTKQGFGKLVSLTSALSVVQSVITSIDEEQVPLTRANGRIISRDVTAPIDVPHFRKSAMDGYAVVAESLFGTSNTTPKQLRNVDSIRAGQTPRKQIAKTECAEIATGAPLPEGADAVVMIEYTERDQDIVTFFKSVAPQENVILIGSDIKKDNVILKQGLLLTPRHTGVLSALGITEVPVRKRVKIGVFSTGNEIQEPGMTPEIGKIFDINRRAIIDALINDGFQVTDFGLTSDDPESIAQTINKGFQTCDLIITSGGSSLGAEDCILEVTKELGEVLVHGIAVKPGKPTTIGKISNKLFFGLPGHPMSALSIYYIIVRPALFAMLNAEIPKRHIYGKLDTKVVSTIGRYEFLPVKIEKHDDGIHVFPVMKGSSAITSLALADGFLEIDENIEVLPRGTEVTVTLF